MPTYAIDGELIGRGGGSRSMAGEIEKLLRNTIDERLTIAPGASLQLVAVNDGRVVKVTVAAGAADSKDATLTIVLVEKVVRYSGENGIRFHPMVARSLASFPIKDGAAAPVHEFKNDAVTAALKKHIDAFEKFDERHNKDGNFRFAERRDTVDWKNVAVVAFVQDSKTKKVLQAAWADAPIGGGR
jgi:hypothetical protein